MALPESFLKQYEEVYGQPYVYPTQAELGLHEGIGYTPPAFQPQSVVPLPGTDPITGAPPFVGRPGPEPLPPTPFPPTAPPPTERNLFENPYAVGSPEFMEEYYGRWPGFGTALGLYGRQALSPYEQYQAGMQPQLETLYDVGGRMGRVGLTQYDPNQLFSQWAPPYAQNPFAMYAQARGMMGGLIGLTPEQRAQAEITTEGADFPALLQMGLRSQLGKQTAGWMAGQIPAARQAYSAQYPQTGMAEGLQGAPSFMDYIMQKYNLGGFF